MNSHSFPPSHSRSSLHNDTIYSSTSHNNIRYYSTIHRPRPHNMSNFPHHRQPLSHTSHHSHTHQNSPWSASAMVPPPPVLQEVYILDCRSCDTFLTNRGMRVSRIYLSRRAVNLRGFRLCFCSNPTFLYTPATLSPSTALRTLDYQNTPHLMKLTRAICLLHPAQRGFLLHAHVNV